MTGKNIFQTPWSWGIFALLAIAGIGYIYNNFDKANPLVNIHVQMDRKAALEKATRLATDFDIGPESYKQAAGFRKDSRFQNFTELEAGGLDTFNFIVSEGYYNAYYWSVRHFKEQEANEAIFWFKPSGETYGFHEIIPESEPGPSLDQEEAMRIAEHHAIYNWDVDLTPYKLEEKSKTEQLSGRTDHTFVYERTDKTVGEAKLRLKLVVSGDKLTTVSYFVKIPENFDRRYSEMRSANQTIQTISTAAIVLFYGLLGIVLGIFVLMRQRKLIWKPPIYWGMGIALTSVFLLTINNLPFAWFSYDTSTSLSNFLFRHVLNGLMGAIGFGALIAVSFMAAEGLGRIAFPRHIRWWKLWSENCGGSIPVLGQTIAGYLFAVLILAFDVLFYVTTKTHLGWWSPAGTLSDPNVLATYLPWLDSIAISLQAGFWEEALFRAVPVAGVFILTKGKKSRPFWVVTILLVQTLIFGAAHANYPQQPSYARVIEMIVPFTIMGVIYIYYGILPAVIAHYAVDVFWISLPLWVSSTSGIWLDRSLVLLFLFLPLFIVFYFRFRNKKWTKVPENDRNAGWKTPALEKEKPEEKIIISAIPRFNNEKWILPLGVIGLVLWIVFTPFKADSPPLTLPKKEAVKMAKMELQKRYDPDFDEWTILSRVNDDLTTQDIFVWRTGGEDTYRQITGRFLTPPHWEIRLVKTKGDAEEKAEEFLVRILNSGETLGITHKIPEKTSGKNLSQTEAQKIADAALKKRFSLNREKLKEISVSPEKQENRTDWEFIYADTLNFQLEQGQGRYRVGISGDEVTNIQSYVHIPEEWRRSYKEANSKKSVIRTIGNLLITGTLILGIILGIIRWTRKRFNLKLFIATTALFAIFHALDNWINRATLMANYNTQVPMENFITMILIGVSLGALFFSLFNGIIVGATPGWLPVRSRFSSRNLLYAISIGLLITGIWAAVEQIGPQTAPSWPGYSYLNGSIPWLGLALSQTTNIIIYPAFLAILFYGIHYFTKAWTSQKRVGIIIISLAGLALMARTYESVAPWIISSILVAATLWAVYFFFIRFHFEYIPLGFGLLLLTKMVEKMIVTPDMNYLAGGTLMIILSFAVLYGWYRVLIQFSEQTGHQSVDNKN